MIYQQRDASCPPRCGCRWAKRLSAVQSTATDGFFSSYSSWRRACRPAPLSSTDRSLTSDTSWYRRWIVTGRRCWPAADANVSCRSVHSGREHTRHCSSCSYTQIALIVASRCSGRTGPAPRPLALYCTRIQMLLQLWQLLQVEMLLLLLCYLK